MNEMLVGLIIGLCVAFAILCVSVVKTSQIRKAGNKEVERLKKMLTDRMELESEGVGKLKSQVEELKKENENLRVSLKTLSQKPGRREIQRLEVMQTAAERLTMNSPGFAPVWQAALKESEEEFKKTFLGLNPFLRRSLSVKSQDVSLITDEKED